MSFIYLLPLVSAIFWGLCYATFERSLAHVSVATYMVAGGIVSILIAYPVAKFSQQPIDFSPLKGKEALIVFIVALASAQIAALATNFATYHVHSTYAAIGEISYPMFTMIFMYVLFQVNYFNWWTMIAMILITAGVVLLIYGEYIFGSSSTEVLLEKGSV